MCTPIILGVKQLTLRQARLRAKLTQVQLATKAGMDQPTISKIERGDVANPAFATVVKLAHALQLDPRLFRFGVRSHEAA